MLVTERSARPGAPTNGTATGPALLTPDAGIIAQIRAHAVRALSRMYRPEERLFAFRVRVARGQLALEGVSRRYTAIVLIGLGESGEATCREVLGGDSVHDVGGRLIGDVVRMENLGDVALALWAARAVRYPERQWAWERLLELRPASRTYPVVELAWSLAALCADEEAPLADLRERLADRLMRSFRSDSGMFPHVVGSQGTAIRAHVSCFADLVYPIHALSQYYLRSGNRQALDIASRCARQICRQQGPAGQWWWHYDRRTGGVIEGYPVYAVHQDAMAPMALLAVQEAGGGHFAAEVAKGLAWLDRAPELGGGSLIDSATDLIWRKVARREPGKLVRYVQGFASRVHPRLRVPGIDIAFPLGAVDREDRPYHLGWVLYAWTPARAEAWPLRSAAE